MEKVYIVVVTREGEEGASVEPVAYRDIADARRRAREIEEWLARLRKIPKPP